MAAYGLQDVVSLFSAECVSNRHSLSHFKDKVIAMDASQYIYNALGPRRTRAERRNNQVDNRGPLLRFFDNCMDLLWAGVKPLFVFDGKPPEMKKPALKKRAEERSVARADLATAEHCGNQGLVEVLKPLTVKVGKKEVKDCKGVLRLLGIPYMYAPAEAEAQCAALVAAGRVFATATQDVDALTFGAKVVLRHFSLKTFKQLPIHEVHLDKLLDALQLNLAEFIDLSILLGCDYCPSIKGLGVLRATELIQKYRNIENILSSNALNSTKISIPSEWQFQNARNLYQKPMVKESKDLKEFKWNPPDEQGILDYLADEKKFNEPLVRCRIQNLADLQETSG